MALLIDALISFVGLFRGLFIGGGLVARIFTWLTSGIGGIITLLTTIGAKIFGGWQLFGMMWSLVSSYAAIELIRRILLVSFVSVVMGAVINYALTHVIIYQGETVHSLFISLISSVDALGPLGHNFLVFCYKFGIFTDLQIIITVMFYTLIARITLHILFK
ncbi:MAG: hypothetical protein R3331_09240 [Sulfurospirillaceae bacterium]|nr:hypothetical protein [Sulfurospirillaceae bacterium]